MTKLEHLQKKHKHLHDKVEALEHEKAPEQYVTKAKKEKLAIKDEILSLGGACD